MFKFVSSVSIVLSLLWVSHVRCQVVPNSMFISCGNRRSSMLRTGISWMNDTQVTTQDDSVGVLIAAPRPPPLTFWQKLLGIKPKITKPNMKPYDAYRKGKNIVYAIPVSKAHTKYNVTLYFYEPT
jgi:hypothetical protein